MPAGALDTVPFLLLPTLRAKGDPGGGVMVNMTLLETPPASGFVTVTLPYRASRRRCREWRPSVARAFANVIVRAAPLRTVDPVTNPLLLTVSVKGAPPAVALLGISAVIAGGTAVACT
jgi:hypothetical protein